MPNTSDTLPPPPFKIKMIEPIKEWYGEGSFVVVRAEKKDNNRTGVIK